jgi:hypothetical protein
MLIKLELRAGGFAPVGLLVLRRYLRVPEAGR